VATPTNTQGRRHHTLLFAQFLRHPRSVGAIAPSSAVLGRAMVEGLDLNGPVRVAELGPGTGAFSRAILARLGPAGRYVAIDREPLFVECLREQWPQRDFVCGSAATLPAVAAERGLSPVDHIVSGLPFASLPAATTVEILDAIDGALRIGGTFTTFQYVHAFRWPVGVAFRREINSRMGRPPSRRLVLWNLPPAYVLRWTRTRSR
jgi:phospholipid N-methyltransferase